jgi:AcrR family transcriptional regulator
LYKGDVDPIVETTEDTRRNILQAAEGRFRQYGYTKTTMAEIAEDVKMSTANLYRYFENKQDMAAACASRCMGERIETLREVVRRPGLGAAERLEAYLVATLHYTHQQSCDQPNVDQLVEIVARERKQIVHEKVEAECALIAEILVQGNESDEFSVQNVIATAEAVHAAMVLFDVPIFMKLYPLEQFERVARAVARLLVRGLAKR